MRPPQIMDCPALPPGICYKCRVSRTELSEGIPNRKYFVDLGVDKDDDYERMGVVYLCNICLGDIVSICPDLFSKEYLDAIVEADHQLVEDANRTMAEANSILETLRKFGFDVEWLKTHSAISEVVKVAEVAEFTEGLPKFELNI